VTSKHIHCSTRSIHDASVSPLCPCLRVALLTAPDYQAMPGSSPSYVVPAVSPKPDFESYTASPESPGRCVLQSGSIFLSCLPPASVSSFPILQILPPSRPFHLIPGRSLASMASLLQILPCPSCLQLFQVGSGRSITFVPTNDLRALVARARESFFNF
jgi:hypothetical protein